MRILLVEDHGIVRHGLRLSLTEFNADLDICEAADIAEALAYQGSTFDLILLDFGLPGINGLEALACMREAFVDAYVVVVSGENSSRMVRAAIDLGAAGYIPKSTTPEVMISALQLVLANGIYLPPQVLTSHSVESTDQSVPSHASTASAAPAAASPLAGLTERQLEVLKLALKGSPNKIIARQLDIAEGTVKSHLSTAFRMLHVRNRTEALYRVAQLGTPI